jgi:endonuclease YncB( thermonuclease family)
MIRPFLVLVSAVFAVRAEAAQISGQGKAIDSQIIQIGDTRVMLFGVDSVMRKQTCELDGKPWQCWSAAVRDLQSLLDQGPVTCDPVGEPDVYGRVLARCLVNGQSLNEELVSRGFAIARPSESTDYVAAEATAKEKKLGLWQGRFRPPSEFRMGAGVAVERP